MQNRACLMIWGKGRSLLSSQSSTRFAHPFSLSLHITTLEPGTSYVRLYARDGGERRLLSSCWKQDKGMAFVTNKTCTYWYNCSRKSFPFFRVRMVLKPAMVSEKREKTGLREIASSLFSSRADFKKYFARYTKAASTGKVMTTNQGIINEGNTSAVRTMKINWMTPRKVWDKISSM